MITDTYHLAQPELYQEQEHSPLIEALKEMRSDTRTEKGVAQTPQTLIKVKFRFGACQYCPFRLTLGAGPRAMLIQYVRHSLRCIFECIVQ